MNKRPNTSIKRPLKINEGTEIETTLNTQKSTQSNIKIHNRPQTAKLNSPNIYNSLSKSTKNPKIDIHQDLEKYISNIEFNNTGYEPYITPYIPKMVKIINKNALIEEEIRSHYWKYEHLFKRPKPSKTGRLMQIITSQFFPLELERQKKKNRKFEVNQDYFL